jgi:cardiolipin synthase A/B
VGSALTLARVGSVALQKSDVPIETHEHALAAVVSGGLLGVSLLGARFPRLFAWPLAALGTAFGGLGVLRATRSALSGCATLREPDNSEQGEQ